MNDLSVRSERYVNVFAKALNLYPPSYRQKYGNDMIQLFRDQLTEAEQLKDRQILSETFWHALLGLPGSIIREHFSRQDSTPTYGQGSVDWLVVSLLFFGFYLLGLLSQTMQANGISWLLTNLFLGASYITAVVATFLTTRRLFLSFVVLALGLLAFMVAAYIQGLIGVTNLVIADNAEPYVSWAWAEVAQAVVPPLLMYALASWFHANPKRFRRNLVNNSNQGQLELARKKIMAHRHRIKTWGLVILSIIIIANLAGLYDPAENHTDLDLPARIIPDRKNMYIELTRLSDIKEIAYIVGLDSTADFSQDDSSNWQITKQLLSLAANGEVTALYNAAAQKPYFQEPSLSDLNIYKSGFDLASADVFKSYGFSEASIAYLAKAEVLRRSGNLLEAKKYAMKVLTVSDAVSSSQGSVITVLGGNRIKLMALRLVNQIYSVSEADDRKAIGNTISMLANPTVGISKALMTEYYVNRLMIEGVRTSLFKPSEILPLSYLQFIPALLPYTFQPNRTLALVDVKYREQLLDLEKPCEEIQSKLSAISNDYYLGINNIWPGLFQYNGIGKIWANSIYYFDNLQRDRCQVEALTKKILHP